MTTFVIRKLFYSVLILLGVTSVTFSITYVLPGDPARMMLGQRADIASVEAIRSQLGLDKPLYVQYENFLAKAVKGDLGRSYSTNRDVLKTLIERFPATAILAITSLTFASLLGVMIGIIAAVRPYTKLDATTMVFALLGISLPSFVMGLLMQIVFGSILKWLPITGYLDRGIEYLILPMLTLGLRPLAVIARVTRSSMLEVMNQDYVRTAKSKGLSERAVIFKHALRNALNPVVTTISTILAGVLAGSFFIEYVFNWPGVGLLGVDSVLKLDFPMVQGTVLLTAVVFVIVNFFVDILYAVLDPKVKLA